MVHVQRTLILSTQQSTLSICNGRCTCTLPAQMETPACPSKQLPDHVHIEPKLEACEDLPPPASDAAEDSETTPLSGNPFFTMVMTRTHVHKRFMLCIPARFHHRLPKVRTATVLLCRGKSWTVDYCGDLKLKRFDAAWMDFAVDNRLRVGDACVFELMTGSTGSESSNKEEEGMTFQVQILRGGLPEEVTSKGATSDEPIVIVD